MERLSLRTEIRNPSWSTDLVCAVEGYWTAKRGIEFSEWNERFGERCFRKELDTA
jgi:hypothetical protein